MGQELGHAGEPGGVRLSGSFAEFEADLSPMRTLEVMANFRAKGKLRGK